MLKDKRQIFIGSDPVISHFNFTPPLVASAELKSEACFIFPINVKGNIYRVDGKKSVEATEGILMRCGNYINKWEAIDKDKDAEVVIIRLMPNILDKIIDEDLQNTIKKNFNKNSTTTSSIVVELDIMLNKYLESLLFYFDNPQIVSEEIALLKIKELSLLLLNSKTPNPVKDLFFSLFEPLKFSLQKIVDANFKEDLSMEELAKLSNMSVSTFKRKFKSLIGESPGFYIRNKRLNWASSQLKATDKPISEISFDAGFGDPNYFSKVFTKYSGISPSKYRLFHSSS